jgi:hypothetical protein
MFRVMRELADDEADDLQDTVDGVIGLRLLSGSLAAVTHESNASRT